MLLIPRDGLKIKKHILYLLLILGPSHFVQVPFGSWFKIYQIVPCYRLMVGGGVFSCSLEAHADTNAAGGSASHVVVNRASSGAHWQSVVGVLYMVELLLPTWRVGPNLVLGLLSCRGFTG